MNQEILFMSDHHFDPTNIIRFNEHPFAFVEEMDLDLGLIKRWNQKLSTRNYVSFK